MKIKTTIAIEKNLSKGNNHTEMVDTNYSSTSKSIHGPTKVTLHSEI